MKVVKILCSIMIAFVVLLAFTSCNNQEKIMQAVQNEWESAGTFDEGSFMQTFSECAEFVFVDMQKSSDDCYTLSYEVTSPDILDALKDYQNNITEIPDDEQMNAKITEIIQKSTPKTTTQTVTVYITDNGYQVVFSQGFIDAMYGYSYTYCMDEIHEVLEGN